MTIPVIALEKIDFLPPDRVTDGSSVLTLKALVMEQMLGWQNGRPAPALFDRFTLSPDGLHWGLQLRGGLHYHDDSPVRAEQARDFLHAILEARDMFGMPWSYARYLQGASITASGDMLDITTPQPFPDLPDILSEFYLPKLDAKDHPTIGTGNWRVLDYAQGQEVVLENRHDQRRLRFIAEPDPKARLDALLSGRIDAAMHLERIEPSLRDLPGFVWQEQAVTLSVIAYMNAQSGPFRDPALRMAANLAIDRDALVSKVMGGLGLPAAGIASPFHLGFAEAGITPHARDLERARALVAAAGAQPVLRLRSPLYMPERSPEIAAFIAGQLREAGFALEIELAHDRPLYARELGAKNMGDLAIFDSSPHSTFRVVDDKISAVSKAVWWQGAEDPTADALFETARRELHPDSRAMAYGKLLHHLHHHPHWLSLFHPIEALGHRPELKGLSLDPKGILRIS